LCLIISFTYSLVRTGSGLHRLYTVRLSNYSFCRCTIWSYYFGRASNLDAFNSYLLTLSYDATFNDNTTPEASTINSFRTTIGLPSGPRHLAKMQPNCLATFSTQLTFNFKEWTPPPLVVLARPGCWEPTSK